MSFIIFFSIVIGIYALANYYVYQKGLLSLSAYPLIKQYFKIVFWFLVLTYPTGRIMEKIYLSYFSDALVWVGSFWLAALLYFFLFCLLIDLISLINGIWHFIPELFYKGSFQKVLFLAVTGGVMVLLAGGFINARMPVVKNTDIHIPKAAGAREHLHAVLISDVHLGTLIGNGYLERIVSEINNISPEIVFIAGDLVDEDLQPVLRQNIGHTLSKLNPYLGVFAVTGNHEFIGGAEEAVSYLEKYGITFLRDTILKVDNSFYVIGREDREMQRFTGVERKPLDELISMADDSYPFILIDHQPFYLKKTAESGIDLQLSGHTHHGQLWPLNYITSAMYKVSHGHENVSGMEVYVTSGVGTWGPPLRIGSRPEIINMKIFFDVVSEK